jgi:hypothetical protein
MRSSESSLIVVKQNRKKTKGSKIAFLIYETAAVKSSNFGVF